MEQVHQRAAPSLPLNQGNQERSNAPTENRSELLSQKHQRLKDNIHLMAFFRNNDYVI